MELTASKASLPTFAIMKQIYIILILATLLVGCQNQSNDTSVYIGGEIINPKSNVVVLMQKEQVIDSLFLATDNTFGANIPIEKEGLYYFQHGYEFQYLFLEPKDSIRLRLNTWDFDETLVFGGKGAQKNQLLLDLFLENEKEQEVFYTYFSLPESEFQLKIDEALQRNSRLLQTIIDSDLVLSKQFLHLAQAAIDYPIYRLKELYPFYHKKALLLDENVSISKDFYAFHEKTDLNDTFLSEYYAYQNYVTARLYNEAYQKNNGEISNQDFQTKLLESIVANITIPEFKNRLLNKEIDNLFFNKPSYLAPKHIEFYYKNCTDTAAVAKFKQLLVDKQHLPKNSLFPDFEVQTISGVTKTINSIIKGKNVVVYFWHSKNVSNEYLSKRMHYLRKKFPEILFIGINTDQPSECNRNLLEKLENQYLLTADSMGKELISTKYPRTILINSKGEVFNSFTLLSNYYIEKELNKLLK